MPITETNTVNDKLIIKYRNDYNVHNSNIEVYIVIPVLTGAFTNGSGDVSVDGFVNGNQINAGINGSSDISISNSSYEKAVLDINGSGSIRAQGLAAKNAEATIHGSGNIELNCSISLKARIYGSGDVNYWGNPAVDVQVSGSGKVRKR